MLFGRRKAAREKAGAVIVSAGNAQRMQGIDKQNMEVGGMPVIVRSILAFEICDEIDEIIVVTKEEQIPQMMQYVAAFELSKVKTIVKGGATRQDSVFVGVENLSEDIMLYFIHDGARPFVSQEVIYSCLRDAVQYGAATAAVKVKDTIKVADEEGFIQSTPPRDTLYSVQTPQVFQRELYRSAMEKAVVDGVSYTDDCQLVEQLGHKVFLSEGSYENIKITTPEDILVAQAIAEEW